MFEGIGKGDYLLSLSAAKSRKADFIHSITADSTGVQLGTVYIQEKYRRLTEVVIQARKPFLERHLDRLTINLEGSTLVAGNSALEALGKLPGMNLSGSSLYFNGMSDILIMVDGKSYRSGSDQGVQVLRSLRAENIEKVEIYTNPPARFDAQGSTVISIVLKKDRMYSSVTAGYNQRLFPSPSISGFGYESFSFNSNISYSFRKLRISSIMSVERSGDSYSRESVFNQLANGHYTRNSTLTSESVRLYGNFRIVYSPDPKNEMSVHVSYVSNPESEILSDAHIEFYNSGGTKDSATRTSVQNSVGYRNPELLVHYLHRFDEKGRRAVAVSAVRGTYRSSFESEYNTRRLDASVHSLLNQLQEFDVDASAFKADYTVPIKNIQLDLGAKTTFLKNNDIYRSPEQSVFSFREVINAGYASLRKTGKSFAYQVGVRAEHTSSSGQSSLLTGKQIRRDYLDIFPSVIIQWSIDKQSRINLSANRRIVRPSYADFNPYRYRTFYDPNVSQAGDVNLRPQYISRYELSYSYKSIYASLSYADRSSVRAMFALPDANNGIKLQAVNISTGDWTALFSYSRQIKSWWQSSSSSNLFYYRSYLPGGEIRKSLAGFVSTNHSLQLAKKIKADLSLKYISAARTHYWETSGFFSMGAGLSAAMFKNNLTATASFEDLLGTNKVEWRYDYGTVKSVTTPLSNSRLFRLSLTYRFRTGNLFQTRSRQSNDFGEIRYGK